MFLKLVVSCSSNKLIYLFLFIFATVWYSNTLEMLLFALDQKGSSDEKFNKLKGMYGKLREEHIQLLRTVC